MINFQLLIAFVDLKILNITNVYKNIACKGCFSSLKHQKNQHQAILLDPVGQDQYPTLFSHR